MPLPYSSPSRRRRRPPPAASSPVCTAPLFPLLAPPLSSSIRRSRRPPPIPPAGHRKWRSSWTSWAVRRPARTVSYVGYNRSTTAGYLLPRLQKASWDNEAMKRIRRSSGEQIW